MFLPLYRFRMRLKFAVSINFDFYDEIFSKFFFAADFRMLLLRNPFTYRLVALPLRLSFIFAPWRSSTRWRRLMPVSHITGRCPLQEVAAATQGSHAHAHMLSRTCSGKFLEMISTLLQPAAFWR